LVSRPCLRALSPAASKSLPVLWGVCGLSGCERIAPKSTRKSSPTLLESTALPLTHPIYTTTYIHTQAGQAQHDLVAPAPRLARRPHQDSRGSLRRTTPLYHPPPQPVILPSSTCREPHDPVRALEARGQEPPRGQEALPLAEEWRRVAGARRQESQHGPSQHSADV
jgi:hypothetical protein